MAFSGSGVGRISTLANLVVGRHIFDNEVQKEKDRVAGGKVIVTKLKDLLPVWNEKKNGVIDDYFKTCTNVPALEAAAENSVFFTEHPQLKAKLEARIHELSPSTTVNGPQAEQVIEQSKSATK